MKAATILAILIGALGLSGCSLSVTATATTLPPTPPSSTPTASPRPTLAPTPVPTPTSEPTRTPEPQPPTEAEIVARAKEMGIIVTDAEGKEKVNALLPLLFEPDKKGQPIQYVSLDGKRQWFSIPRNEDVGSDRYGQFKTGVVVQLDDLSPGRHRAGFSAVVAAEPFRNGDKLLMPLLADSDRGPVLFYLTMEEGGVPNWLGLFVVKGGNWWSTHQEFTSIDPTERLEVFKPGRQLVTDIAGGDVDVSDDLCDGAKVSREVCLATVRIYNKTRLSMEDVISGRKGLEGVVIPISGGMAIAVP